jgi:hypothetical protein
MANIPVNFDTLAQNHVDFHHIKALLSGDIKKNVDASNWSTCAIQISYALNHSGAVIPPESYAYKDARVFQGKVRGLTDDAGYVYIYSVVDMSVYLDKRYGVSDTYQGSKDDMVSKISGRKGIIAFGIKHVDLWMGDTFHQDGLGFTEDFWAAPSVKTTGIHFWEITSEWGF